MSGVLLELGDTLVPWGQLGAIHSKNLERSYMFSTKSGEVSLVPEDMVRNQIEANKAVDAEIAKEK